MDKLMVIIAIFLGWVFLGAWHSVHPDITFSTKENVTIEEAKNLAFFVKPDDGFWKTMAAFVAPSKTNPTQYCVWYVKGYESLYVWEELEKRGRLKCK